MCWRWVNDDWFEADAIEKRLKERVSLIEFGAIIFLVTWLFGLVFVVNQKSVGLWGDLQIYLACGNGKCSDFFYGYWLIPIFTLLSGLPIQITYIIWGLINIAGAWFATRVFGGNKFLALVSYPLLSILWYGQIGGLIISGLALGWYGIVKRNWVLSGIGLGIALAKYNVALILIIPIIIGSKIKVKEWAQIILWPVIFLGISLLIYPGWFTQLINRIYDHSLATSYSVSIWPYLGPISLALFIPLLFLPKNQPIIFIGWIIVGTIGLPYYQLRDILLLLTLPLPTGIALIIGYFGFIHFFLGNTVVQIYIVFLIVMYVFFLWQTLIVYKNVNSINFFNKKSISQYYRKVAHILIKKFPQ